MTEPTWLSLAQVAKRIGISKRTLSDAVNARDHTRLPAVKTGGKWLVRTKDADEYPAKAYPSN